MSRIVNTVTISNRLSAAARQIMKAMQYTHISISSQNLCFNCIPVLNPCPMHEPLHNNT